MEKYIKSELLKIEDQLQKLTPVVRDGQIAQEKYDLLIEKYLKLTLELAEFRR